MTTEGSDFTHIMAPSATSSSNDESRASTPTAKHVRMGRGLVAVTRYENEGTRRIKRPTTSPTSPSTPSPVKSDIVPGQTPNRKWYHTAMLRRRNVSLGGALPTLNEASTSSKRGDIKSWVETQAHESWQSSRDDAGPGSTVIDIRKGAPLPKPLFISPASRPELSINPNYHDNTALPSIRSRSQPEPIVPPHTPSPLQNTIDEDEDDQDESGRILLEALGLVELAPPASPVEEAEQQSAIEEQTNTNNPTTPPVLPALEFGLPITCSPEAPTLIRRLPMIPPPPLPTQPEQPTQIAPPHDSQDAFAYVFNTLGPRPSAQYRESLTAPPPPYASRQSAVLDRPSAAREDALVLEQQWRGLMAPRVAPLAIRKRDDKQAQRRLVVENN